MAAHDNLGDQFRRGLEKEAEGMRPEDRSFLQGVARNLRTEPVRTPGAPPGGVRMTTGLGPGPIDALDADNIDRARSAASRLQEWGMPASTIGTKFPRGVSLDISPNHNVVLSPSSGGWSVDIDHHEQFAEDPSSPTGYKHPEGWGRHRSTLNVDEQDLPNALMDHLADPKVRRAAALDEDD